ncbi:MAG: HD domain-containing protein [Saprospiraceae bacterium]|jgi:HD superfamily phosphohydrolase|nr:HD domain-containing protein [Saprospiraceae bacterium]
MNKKKIFNDPIYGLIRFNHEVLYEIIDHPYFQRLRRITQQSLSHYVYPGAQHTRFQHALGALHLMTRALEVLKLKEVYIAKEEYEASCIAILLHDVGHGPFSHSLEYILANVHHEDVSLAILKKIGHDLGRDFSLAIQIFKGDYHRPFLHQLVSGQIDTDRMDYLTRDSFFSGVAEGIIGYDRIITMMNVVNAQLVIEEKGIYSIEKFLMARRLMYWQVYLHKTVISAEIMLIAILKRAGYLLKNGVDIATSDELNYFLNKTKSTLDINDNSEFISNYMLLDDMDILWMIKKSVNHDDFILSYLCQCLLDRKLFKVYTDASKATIEKWENARDAFSRKYSLSASDLEYFFFERTETVKQYDNQNGEINILLKSGEVKAFSDLNTFVNNKEETRIFRFYPVH